jgi:hypothetical protein
MDAQFVESCYAIAKRAYDMRPMAPSVHNFKDATVLMHMDLSDTINERFRSDNRDVITTNLANCIVRIMALAYAEDYPVPEAILRRLTLGDYEHLAASSDSSESKP